MKARIFRIVKQILLSSPLVSYFIPNSIAHHLGRNEPPSSSTKLKNTYLRCLFELLVFFNWAIPALFVFIFIFLMQLFMVNKNCRWTDLWCWKRLLHQLCHNHCSLVVFFLKKWAKPSLFFVCFFVLFTRQIVHKNYNWLKLSWCAWGSNLGRQDGRCRRIHWAMAAAL